MKDIENKNATIKREKQERVARYTPDFTPNSKVKKVLTTKKKKVEPVPAFKMNKNNGIYTITMNYYMDDGRLDTTEEPVVFKLADHTNDMMEGMGSTSSFDVEFVTPGAIHALQKKNLFQDDIGQISMISSEVLPPNKLKFYKKKE